MDCPVFSVNGAISFVTNSLEMVSLVGVQASCAFEDRKRGRPVSGSIGNRLSWLGLINRGDSVPADGRRARAYATEFSHVIVSLSYPNEKLVLCQITIRS